MDCLIFCVATFQSKVTSVVKFISLRPVKLEDGVNLQYYLLKDLCEFMYILELACVLLTMCVLEEIQIKSIFAF